MPDYNHFDRILDILEKALRALEERVPRPQRKKFLDGYVFRYTEQTIYQAILQKLARIVSGLGAAQVLLRYGFVQEQASIQRMLDESGEDVQFLVYAIIFNEVTDLHKEYLSYFWEEEFDNPENPIESTQKRGMVSRKKIRAYLSRADLPDPHRGIKLSKCIHKAYSGFVHGASPHIMDLYGGNPPHFHVRGMLGTPRIQTSAQDLYHYFYRSIVWVAFGAKVLGEESIFISLRNYADDFGKNFNLFP